MRLALHFRRTDGSPRFAKCRQKRLLLRCRRVTAEGGKKQMVENARIREAQLYRQLRIAIGIAQLFIQRVTIDYM